MCEYLTNDTEQRYFTDKYLVDICTPDDEYLTEYFETLEEMLNFIQEKAGGPVVSMDCIEGIEEKWQEQNPDACCNVHEFRYVY